MWRHIFRQSFTRTSLAGPLRGTARFQMSRGWRRFSSSEAQSSKMGMKELVKKYGWTATGVYLTLGCIDLPLFYLLVHSTGLDVYEQAEIKIREAFGMSTNKTWISRARGSQTAQFAAEFGVAYLLHKIFIVVRVPLTVALTPKVSQFLRRRGYNLHNDSVKSKFSDAKDKARNKVIASKANARSADSGATTKGPQPKDLQPNGKPDFGRPPTKKNKWFAWLF